MDVTSTSPFQALAAIRPSNRPAGARADAAPRDASARDDRTREFQPNESRKPNGQTLTKEERAQVDKLRARDQEVRTHEQAHVAAAGALFRGGPFYTYQQGPDGKRYAVGGSVKIDTSEGRTPEETIQRAAQIRAAALAPAEPSGADRAIAANAARMEAQARQELAAEQAANQSESGEDDTGTTSPADTAATEREPTFGIESPSDSEAADRAVQADETNAKSNGRRLDFAAAEASAFATSLGAAIDTFG
ncbi:MAG: putative metalloprotease CJM1_0395 family protein [Planctomycetota bacterium]